MVFLLVGGRGGSSAWQGPGRSHQATLVLHLRATEDAVAGPKTDVLWRGRPVRWDLDAPATMATTETALPPPPVARAAVERRRARRPKRPSSLSVGGAVGRFAVTGFLALVLVGFGAVEVLRHAGRSEATRDARVLGQFAGHGIIAPAITPGLLRGDPQAIAAMDRVVSGRVLGGAVLRVK